MTPLSYGRALCAANDLTDKAVTKLVLVLRPDDTSSLIAYVRDDRGSRIQEVEQPQLPESKREITPADVQEAFSECPTCAAWGRIIAQVRDVEVHTPVGLQGTEVVLRLYLTDPADLAGLVPSLHLV